MNFSTKRWAFKVSLFAILTAGAVIGNPPSLFAKPPSPTALTATAFIPLGWLEALIAAIDCATDPRYGCL